MPGRGAALENLDDDHASAAAWARVREGGRLVAIFIIGICSLALGLLGTEQLAGACDVVGAGSLGEQAVVSDAVEALRQDMDEEATDELVCCERHHLVAIGAFDPIVLVLEADSAFVERDQDSEGGAYQVVSGAQLADQRTQWTIAQILLELGDDLGAGAVLSHLERMAPFWTQASEWQCGGL